jgi:hypothetical protein
MTIEWEWELEYTVRRWRLRGRFGLLPLIPYLLADMKVRRVLSLLHLPSSSSIIKHLTALLDITAHSYA